MYKVDNITFSYNNKKIFEHFSLEINQGDFITLLGDNGAGKTTLLNLLGGFIQPAAGTITFKGQPVGELLTKTLTKKNFYASLGILFQETDVQLFNSSVYDEVAFGPRQLGYDEPKVQKVVMDSLEMLGITELLSHVPYQLSGGEKKKVAFASILAMNPDVYLLDEPFNGLSKEAQDKLLQLLIKLNALGKTILLATHNCPAELQEKTAILFFEPSSIHFYSQAMIKSNQILKEKTLKY